MAQLLIHLADVNDNPPVFDQPSYRVQIYSDYTVGTTILRPLASDADSGTAGHPTYSLLNGVCNYNNYEHFVCLLLRIISFKASNCDYCDH